MDNELILANDDRRMPKKNTSMGSFMAHGRGKEYRVQAKGFGETGYAYFLQDSLVVFLNSIYDENIVLVNSYDEEPANTTRSLISFTTKETRSEFAKFLLDDVI